MNVRGLWCCHSLVVISCTWNILLAHWLKSVYNQLFSQLTFHQAVIEDGESSAEISVLISRALIHTGLVQHIAEYIPILAAG